MTQFREKKKVFFVFCISNVALKQNNNTAFQDLKVFKIVHSLRQYQACAGCLWPHQRSLASKIFIRSTNHLSARWNIQWSSYSLCFWKVYCCLMRCFLIVTLRARLSNRAGLNCLTSTQCRTAETMCISALPFFSVPVKFICSCFRVSVSFSPCVLSRLYAFLCHTSYHG